MKKTLKIVYLAPASSIHTVRWANSMAEKGLSVFLISLHKPNPKNKINKKVKLHLLPLPAPLGYLGNIYHLRRLITKIKPDVVHAHFASGYGTLLRKLNFHPCVLSVWGSDIDKNVQSGVLKQKIIKENLKKADVVTATSSYLRQQVRSFVNGLEIPLVFFGVDTKIKVPSAVKKEAIGAVKALEQNSGNDILIRAFSKVVKNKKYENEKLIIVGEGSQKKQLLSLAAKLGIAKKVELTGEVPHRSVFETLNKFKIFLCLSRAEGFGVSVLEAAYCRAPVIVSNVGGLPETLLNGKTGYIAKSSSPDEAAKLIMKLLDSPKLRKQMGEEGRRFVIKNYSWDRNVERMINIYQKLNAQK